MRALPIYMPLDTAIPAPEIPAEPSFVRSFVRVKRILQREAVGSSALQLPAYGLLADVVVVWLAAMCWGLVRLGRAGTEHARDLPPSAGPRPREGDAPEPRPRELVTS